MRLASGVRSKTNTAARRWKACAASASNSRSRWVEVVIARSAQRDEAISATRVAQDARLLRGACHRARQRPDPLARNDELVACRQLNAPLKSCANCRVVIGARPTISWIGLVFSWENAPLWPARAIETRCANNQYGMFRDFIPASACSSVTST